eukprot:COSAG02_NODE_9756_length_2119_cov_30.113165_1_plen_539_part_10
MKSRLRKLLTVAAVAVTSVVVGLILALIVPCAWASGSFRSIPGLDVSMGPEATFGILLSQCRGRFVPQLHSMLETLSDLGLERQWHRWLRWRAQGETIRGMVAPQTAEDLEWFANESWGERLSSVPVWDSPDPPDYATFWREHISSSVPLLIRSGARLSGWDPAQLPWRREWLEDAAGASEVVPVHLNLDRCWSRIHEGGGRLVRPASLDLPLRSALRLVASDGGGETDPEGQDSQEGCDGEAATAVDALLRGESTQYTVRAAELISGDGGTDARQEGEGEGEAVGAEETETRSKARTSSAVVHTIEEVSIPRVLTGLLEHVPEPPWTGDLLEPLATNIWVGSANKTSVLHFDDYENILVQAAGRKTITLFDPMQLVFLYANEVPQVELTVTPHRPESESDDVWQRFVQEVSEQIKAEVEARDDQPQSRRHQESGDQGTFDERDEEQKIRDRDEERREYLQRELLEPDTRALKELVAKRSADLTFGLGPPGPHADNFSPLRAHNPDLARYPNYRHAHPLTVTLEAGDALFLPALWWHEV